jgi:hypothetical protein
MSRAAEQAKMALARRCAALPELGAALQDGRIGTVGATLIGRVADAETVAAWVARAAERTVKHLREEIDAAGLVARVSGARGALTPPDAVTVAAVQDVERAVLAGERAAPRRYDSWRRALIWGDPAEPGRKSARNPRIVAAPDVCGPERAGAGGAGAAPGERRARRRRPVDGRARAVRAAGRRTTIVRGGAE